MNKKVLRIALIALVVAALFVGVSSCNSVKFPSFKYDNVNLVQLQQPQDGQEIAIIETSQGTFKIALYRDKAPKTVENFVKLANEGYYDGTYIYRVDTPTFFFGGTKNKNGVFTKSDSPDFKQSVSDIEMTKIPVETTPDLWPLKGAIMSMGPELGYDQKEKKYYSGSFILGINGDEFNKTVKEKLEKEKKKDGNNSAIIDAFLDKGGVPTLDHINHYTIFAQVYDGWDNYNKLFKVDVDSKNQNAPKEDIVIKSVKISKYGE